MEGRAETSGQRSQRDEERWSCDGVSDYFWGEHDNQEVEGEGKGEGNKLRPPHRVVGVFSMDDAVIVTKARQ